MLLIDGVKYYEWIPEKEVEQFHPMVREHIREIFGEKSKFIEGSRLQSLAKKGSEPDGFVLVFGNEPQWHIVEMELSCHQLYDHIVNQVGRFINGIENSRKRIIDAIYRDITENKVSKAEVEEAVGSGEIYKFLVDLISKPPILTIIIEEKTKELEEAISLLRYSTIKIVEFRTFRREDAESVHAHLFEPIYTVTPPPPPPFPPPPDGVNMKDLIEAGLLKVGQEIHNKYKGNEYKGKILEDGDILLIHSGQRFGSLSGAAVDVIKSAAVDITKPSVNGWTWWSVITESGEKRTLKELRDEYRRKQVKGV